MERIYIPNLILVSGSGRKSGKTTFICNLLHFYSKQVDIIGVKVTKHIHSGSTGNLLFYDKFYSVFAENNNSDKDSSLYLKAGASRSYYIESEESSVALAFDKLYNSEIQKESLIICESGSLVNYFLPAVKVFIENSENDYSNSFDKMNNRNLSDIIITLGSEEFNNPQTIIKVENNSWKIDNAFSS